MFYTKGASRFGVFTIIGLMAGTVLFGAPPAYAADGSGTNTVSPTSTDVLTTGNVFTFTFTAAETMDSGGIAIEIPSGFSAPQGMSGTAGYTTVNTTGIIADVKDAADSTTGWDQTGGACGNTAPVVSTTVFHENGASISCPNGNVRSGDRWYKNISSENWSGYSQVGFWVQSSNALANNTLQFSYDNNANLASPLESINIGAVEANTWTYIKLNFGATTRTAILSYGLRINSSSGVDNRTVYIDDILLGPGSLTFSSNSINARFLQLASSGTATITYGDGGGASGVTAPSTSGMYAATTTSRFNDSGMLTDIASHPTITVTNPTPTLTSISPTSATVGDPGFTMSATGSGFVSGATALRFAGSARTTTVTSSTTLTASILTSDLTTAGTFNVTIGNPTPGGGTSTAQAFTVNNPVPTITSLSPTSTTAGGSDFILTINGTNFVSDTTATFNGVSKTITFVSSTQITIPILATDIATAGTSTITVANPAPGGGTATSTDFVVIDRAVKLVISGSPYAGTVDAPIIVTVQAQKTDDGVDTTFNGSVTLSLHSMTTYATTSNNIMTIVNGSGTFLLSDQVAETVLLSLLDTASTSLDVTSTGTAMFAAGAVTRLTLTHDGDVPQFSRKEFVIGRLDQFDNEVSATSTLTYLYASPTTTSGLFYVAQTGSTTVTSITINPGSTSTNVWYGNGVLNTYVITASDNATAPDGTAGIGDATSTIEVTPVATNLQIIDPGSGTTDNPLTVQVEARDDNGNVATSYAGNVTLLATGQAIVANSGTMTFVAGIATTTVTDTVAESITLSLSGSELTATSTREVTFAVGQFAKLAINGPTSATAGTLSAFTMTRTDAHDNNITSGEITITLSVTPTTTPGTFYSANSTSSESVSATSIVNGQASTTIYYYNEVANAYQLTFTSGSVSRSASITIDPSTVATFGLTSVSSSTNPGGRLQLTVSRKDRFNNAVQTGSDAAYMYASQTSSSTAFYDVASGGSPVPSVTIDPGASTKYVWYYETVTGSYTITASDNATAPDGNTGIIDASVPVNVQVATATQFVIDTPDPQTIIAGNSTVVTIKAKDAFGNVDTSYGNDVTLVTGVSSVTASGLNNGQVLVDIQNGIGTVTLTDTIAETVNMALSDTQGTGLNASSTATATWIPGSTAQFVVTDISAGGTFYAASSTRQFRVTRKDQFNNLVSSGTDLAYLYSTSNGASFRASETSTSSILFVAIAGSATSTTFWYYDTEIGTWDITASNNPAGSVGLNGFTIGTVQIDVVAAPVIATRYSIVVPAGIQQGQTATVVIKAVDDNGFTQTDYDDFVDLIVSTSSATISGLVGDRVQIHIVNGVGTVSVMDPIAETIHLSLAIPSFSTSTLNASSTVDLVFAMYVAPISGGAGVWTTFGLLQSAASFTGKAFPGAEVTLFAKTSAGDIPVQRALKVAADGTFRVEFIGILNGLQAFCISITDPKSHTTKTKIYSINPVTGLTAISDIFVPPTATFVRKTVPFGNNVGLSGYGTPGSTIRAKIDGKLSDVTTKVQKDGTYKLLLNTYGLAYGPHILQTQQVDPKGAQSDFSTQGVFIVTKTLIAGADMNNNGKVDIGDMSIFLANFKSTDPSIRNLNDINGDGKVNLADLSVFLRATGSVMAR